LPNAPGEPLRRADRVAAWRLLRENPVGPFEAYDGIVKVILHGKVLDRAGLAAPPVADAKWTQMDCVKRIDQCGSMAF
jgi:hypothetical protein